MGGHHIQRIELVEISPDPLLFHHQPSSRHMGSSSGNCGARAIAVSRHLKVMLPSSTSHKLVRAKLSHTSVLRGSVWPLLSVVTTR